MQRKIIYVNDGVKTKSFNASQVPPVTIKNKTEDEALDHIFKHSDETERAQKESEVYMTEVLKDSDPRTKNKKAQAGVKKELDDLFEQGMVKLVKAEDIPKDAIILPNRTVYAIKNSGTLEELYKARITAGGHMDDMKELMIHSSVNLKHGSVRMITSTAANKRWKLWSKDADQAFAQCDEMMRTVVLMPAPEFKLPPRTLLRILKFLYGLSESGDAWHQKLKNKIIRKLKMRMITGDQALFYHTTEAEKSGQEEGNCDGLLGTYVEDILFSGTEKFEKHTKKLDEKIKVKPAKKLPITFAGLSINKEQDGTITIDQSEYIRKLTKLEKDCTYEDFRSYRHKLAWIASSRPDITAASNLYSQVTQEIFEDKHVKQMNNSIKYLQDTVECKLRYTPLDLELAKIVVVADGSHATNMDSTSQLGYLVFLTDHVNWNLIHYRSTKSRRVVRSPLAAETHAVADAADMAIMV